MQGRNQLIIGIGVLLIGILFLVGNLFNVDIWNLLFPSILILIGIWMLFRPQLEMAGPTKFHIIGEYSKTGVWNVVPEDHWMFVGDIHLDFREAVIPDGITHLQISGFVGKVVIDLPDSIGLKITSNAFVTESKMFNESKDYIFTTVRRSSENYENALKKIHINTTFFVGEIATKLK